MNQAAWTLQWKNIYTENLHLFVLFMSRDTSMPKCIAVLFFSLIILMCCPHGNHTVSIYHYKTNTIKALYNGLLQAAKAEIEEERER